MRWILLFGVVGCGGGGGGADAGLDAATADPGRVVLHRLNRAEYNNTVRDLFGTALRPADRFPSDDFGLGFDNQAHVLSLSPLHIEQYDQAADELLDELFAVGFIPTATQTIEAEGPDVTADNGAVWDLTGWVLWTEGALSGDVWLDQSGDYTLQVDAYGLQGGDEPVQMAVIVDGVEVDVHDVEAEASEAFSARLSLDAGMHTVSMAFLNDYKDPALGIDRNLVVDRFALTGPLEVPRTPPAGRGLVLTCDPAVVGEGVCVAQITRDFGLRAWRRPLSEAEVATKLQHYTTARGLGGDWNEGVRAVLRSLLLSPHFIYRGTPNPLVGVGRTLNGHELASRLSYFIWSSTPDDRLLQLAATDALTDPAVLDAEARRMLTDPRATALIDNLAGQWLGIRKIEEAQPAASLYPEFDEGLRASMKREAELFVQGILLADRSALELMSAPETWVDQRLAAHYGIAVPDGPGMHRVEVPDRIGLMSKSGLLAALSYPTRTSPVVRGKWVLENLMCTPPPPPPPGVEGLPAQQSDTAMSLRETMEQHRSDPVCAACHVKMDAAGFALEPFDALGRARTLDDYGFPIDATGTWGEGGPAFDGPTELAAVLVEDPAFPTCIASKTFTYALGRPPTDTDDAFLAEIEAAFATADHRFTDLVVAIVQSRAFREQGVTP